MTKTYIERWDAGCDSRPLLEEVDREIATLTADRAQDQHRLFHYEGAIADQRKEIERLQKREKELMDVIDSRDKALGFVELPTPVEPPVQPNAQSKLDELRKLSRQWDEAETAFFRAKYGGSEWQRLGNEAQNAWGAVHKWLENEPASREVPPCPSVHDHMWSGDGPEACCLRCRTVKSGVCGRCQRPNDQHPFDNCWGEQPK